MTFGERLLIGCLISLAIVLVRELERYGERVRARPAPAVYEEGDGMRSEEP